MRKHARLAATGLAVMGFAFFVEGAGAQQTFLLPSTTTGSSWTKLGTVTASQQGFDVTVQIVSSQGFNALISQDQVSYVHFKTSNDSSVDANGFAGDSWWYTTGESNAAPANIKWVANAAGVAATAFTLYADLGYYSAKGFYVVNLPTGATWTNYALAGQTDPGAASSTVEIPTNEFFVGSTASFANNVGVGTTTPGAQLEVNGNIKLTAGSGGSLTFADGTTQSTASNPLITQSNGVTTIGAGGTGGAGFQFSAAGQTIGGVFGEGGNMMLQADAVTDTAHTGGLLFLGGNARGDGLAGKVFMTGDQNPSVKTSTSALMLNASNNVGIGLSPYSNPASRLEVNGNITLTQGSGADMEFQDGTVQATAWNGVLQGGDYAESVDVTGNRAEYEPGDVLVVDANAEGRFVKSSTAYSTAVMGIYSTRPGVVGRRQRSDRSHMAEEVPMAMIGVVPTKVTSEGGPIKPGDLLVTSSTPGYAMKGTDRSLLTGAVIGKALGHLDSDRGLIEVAVSLQ